MASSCLALAFHGHLNVVPAYARFGCGTTAGAGAVRFQQTVVRPHGDSKLMSQNLMSQRSLRLGGRKMSIVAVTAVGNQQLEDDGDEDPYEVLRVTPITKFDKIKLTYTKQRKDAERRFDGEHVAKLDRAYEKIMMMQLHNRKKGVTFGSLQVSKDIKYADKQPIVPWGPRYAKSSVKDMSINMAISAVFAIWILVRRSAEWRPLQFLAFAFFFRIFDKLKYYEPAVVPILNEYGEDRGRGVRMGKRFFRSLSLVFGCITAVSLGYTGLLNIIELLGQYIPQLIYNNQELIITTGTSVLLYIIASYYR